MISVATDGASGYGWTLSWFLSYLKQNVPYRRHLPMRDGMDHTEPWIWIRRHKIDGVENPALRHSEIACSGPKLSEIRCTRPASIQGQTQILYWSHTGYNKVSSLFASVHGCGLWNRRAWVMRRMACVLRLSGQALRCASVNNKVGVRFD